MKDIFNYINPFGPIFWCGFVLGLGVGGIVMTLVWYLVKSTCN